MTNDPALRDAVDVMGVHYPCRGIGQPAISCLNTSPLQAIGKPIWASEHGSQHFNLGAPQLARAVNRDYIDSRITAMIDWNAVASRYQTLPDWGESLMQADQPWSGWYVVGKSIWVMAHTAQFAQPGWRYLDAASGYLGGARANGSFVSLVSPNGSDWSSVIETTTATAPQTATFTLTGGASTGTVHVWATSLTDPSVRQLHPAAGRDPGRRQLHRHAAARLRVQPHDDDRAGERYRHLAAAGGVAAAVPGQLRVLPERLADMGPGQPISD